MDTTNRGPAQQGREVKAVLVPYFIAMIALTVITHIIIAIRGPVIDGADVAIFFVTSFLPALAFYVTRTRRLREIRFGALAAHAGTYAIVNAGWQLHAYFQTVSGAAGKWASAEAVGALPLDDSWVGPTFGMAGFWGIGLVVHVVAVAFMGGYEDKPTMTAEAAE